MGGRGFGASWACWDIGGQELWFSGFLFAEERCIEALVPYIFQCISVFDLFSLLKDKILACLLKYLLRYIESMINILFFVKY